VSRPSIGFVGIHSGGRPGQATSQSEVLAALFAGEGVRVRSASVLRRPVLRTLHQLAAVLVWRAVPVVVVDVFSGPSFLMAELATRLARLRGRRVVLFLHGGGLGDFAATRRRRVERVLAGADDVLAPSEFLAEVFRPWGYDVRVVPNVVAAAEQGSPPRSAARPTMLWMRTFHEHYDPLTAVRALALIAERLPDARLTMAGADHGLLEATRREAERLGVGDRIDFPGYLSGDAKVRALRDHDLFLNTNVVDNTPVSLLEACGAGMVPVATAVGGVPHLVHDDVDAVLVPPGDAAAMAGAVAGLIDDPGRYSRLSRGAVELAGRSSWPEVRTRWFAELGFVAPATFDGERAA
jgi:glycosyltransferase involved in cell wall biosynthesis